MWHDKEMPNLNVKEHIWQKAEPLKNGDYSDVDWNTITPIDEELIESMQHCEAVFMTMITRTEEKIHRKLLYDERKPQSLAHMRYWNHILDAKKIDLFLLNHQPHQNYDLVIYDLCQLKGIQTFIVERCSCVDAFFLVETWEKSAIELKAKLEELDKD